MTMENEIKKDTNLLTARLIAKLYQPTWMSINFFSQPTKILNCQSTLHTFASRTIPTHKPKLAKECNLTPLSISILLSSILNTLNPL